MTVRRISPGELEVMRAWLSHDVEGAAELGHQLTDETQVYSSCDCGCASIGFVGEGPAPDLGVFIFGIDAEIVDRDGVSVGGMMLTIRNGRLHDVDVYSWFDELAFPGVDQIRWHARELPNESE